MLLSMLIIVFNKWILDRYPFPMILTTWHMLCATMATQFLANFTTLVDDRKKSKMTLAIYFKAIIPIGLCFSLSLWFGNMAYLYLSMSFIQMLKARFLYHKSCYTSSDIRCRPLLPWSPYSAAGALGCVTQSRQ